MLHRILIPSLRSQTALGNHTHIVTKQQQQSCSRPQRLMPESLVNVNPPLRLGPNNSTKTNAEIYCTSSLLIMLQFRHSISQSLYQGVERDWFNLDERKHYKDSGKAESSASVLLKAFWYIFTGVSDQCWSIHWCLLLLNICLRTNKALKPQHANAKSPLASGDWSFDVTEAIHFSSMQAGWRF